MKKKINYYLVATALFVTIATMVSMTVINYYLLSEAGKGKSGRSWQRQ